MRLANDSPAASADHEEPASAGDTQEPAPDEPPEVSTPSTPMVEQSARPQADPPAAPICDLDPVACSLALSLLEEIKAMAVDKVVARAQPFDAACNGESIALSPACDGRLGSTASGFNYSAY